jgi:hypothetical protein
MFESIGRSFQLVKTSWGILMDDRKLLVFPILSGIVTLLVILSFIVPLILTPSISGIADRGSIAFYAVLFAFYVASYFVVIFFNTALISCVSARLHGKDISVGEGLSVATRHIVPIFCWAVVSATIGLILNIIEERFEFVGQIVGAIVGGVWSLVTFFVVPILVLEDKGVVDSVMGSVSLIRKTWGESIVGAGSIAIVFFAAGILVFLLALGLFFATKSLLLAGAIFLVLLAIIGVVATAMQGIYVTALYTYAKTGTVPGAFDRELIQGAFMPKQAGLQSGPGNI